jgi:hypothetical protein
MKQVHVPESYSMVPDLAAEHGVKEADNGYVMIPVISVESFGHTP